MGEKQINQAEGPVLSKRGPGLFIFRSRGPGGLAALGFSDGVRRGKYPYERSGTAVFLFSGPGVPGGLGPLGSFGRGNIGGSSPNERSGAAAFLFSALGIPMGLNEVEE